MAGIRTCRSCGTQYLCDLRSKRELVCPECGDHEVIGVGHGKEEKPIPKQSKNTLKGWDKIIRGGKNEQA